MSRAAHHQLAEPPRQAWGPEAVRFELLQAIEYALLQVLRRISAPAGAARLHIEKVLPGGVAAGCTKRAERLAEQLLRLLGSSSSPGTLRKSQRLKRLLALLDSVHGLLKSGRHATPRELYYTHATLFPRQQLSDDLVKWLCQVLEVPRHYLRLVGTAKGLVRGHLRLLEPRPGHCIGSQDAQAIWIDCMDPLEPRGHSISPVCAHLLRTETMARTVLVVEKETVFYRLLGEELLERHRPCVIVTARGFPDVPTRYLLRQLWSSCAKPRFHVLVDFDPHGLAIAATYAFGPGTGLDWIREDLSLPEAQPLLCPGGVPGAARYGLDPSEAMKLTPKDRAVALGLQQRFLQMATDGRRIPAAFKEALDMLLDGGLKYEIDALENLSALIDDSWAS
eukprot:TRINITY_DN15143_c0_g1_i2.p1 TRINITY_DN15143_c0_g1~~TRINITY_DN15143_c0_g1_i2.p1  ORF type:complete len:393 (-),score=61.53 TRINITY_DN15143_c0_g1_i2:131-1309(-)